MIIGGSASQDLASHVAKELGEEICYVETKKFPDGERYLRIDGQIEDEVTVIQSTGYPQDENLMELMFIVSTLKDLGAKKVKVVVPYLGYARQEKRFKDGESVSAKIICNLIEAAGADEFITFLCVITPETAFLIPSPAGIDQLFLCDQPLRSRSIPYRRLGSRVFVSFPVH